MVTDELVDLTNELAAVRSALEQVLGRLKIERRRAWWHRGVSLLLVLLVAGLGIVAWHMHQQRTANCEAIANAFDAYTEALANFSTEGADREPEAQERFDARVEVFRAEIATRLADCK